MIPVSILIDDIEIRNIEADELSAVLGCVNESEDNFMALGRDYQMDYAEIEQRYLESLMNSLEFFCGIYLKNKQIGIIKGRIENKNETELWILSYLFLKGYRGKGIGKKVLQSFEEHFQFNYSINKFCILIMENNSQGLRFWTNNNYIVSRITKATNLNSISKMVILEKKIGRKQQNIY
jgi:GNAT superfamily N-acetyltransferase